MPAQRKPEEIVPTLLDRLKKVRDALGPINEKYEKIVSGFEEIETELEKMKDWEGELIKRFRTLVQYIDIDVWFDRLKHGNADDILNGLELIRNSVASVKQLFPAKESQVTEITRSEDQAVGKDQTTSEDQAVGKDQTMPKEWSRLGVEEKIYVSKVISDFRKSFDCLKNNQLKVCSLCLSIFPENSIINKRPLIYWWIGEGMVTKTSEKTAEKVGEDVFGQLINESFIIPKFENHSSSINSFTVCPWIRRMLISVAKGLHFFEFTPSGMLRNDHRRAFLFAGPDDHDPTSAMTDDTLTVFNLNYRYLQFKPDWLSRLNRVEVLQLGRWQNSVEHHIEVESEDLIVESKKKKKVQYEVSLNGLGSQTSLRYLSLRGVSRLTNLPRSVLKLISLEILDLHACHSLEKLPSDISALRNLTHLDVSECYLLESMPDGIHKLSALQVLKGFVIGRVGRNPCKLSQLAQLKNLRKLSIRIGNEAVGEGEFSNLKDFKALEILVISCGAHTEAALKTISVPPKLKKLDLWCIPLQDMPDWQEPGALQNLEKLYIRGGELESLKNQGQQTWKVKILRLKYLKNLKIDKQELQTMFPEVEYLEKVKCNKKIVRDEHDPDKKIVRVEYDPDITWNKRQHEKAIVATT
ncbi:disease resistance RPP13-like protein 4 [Coffea eugenioides]|uniref:disease resistance RPP13-like protein 4 n=1 Tax=Coffea eugenioides TaxID=49369 RepID=UPI000F6071A8|nr:disease resistance RPP13-like protein 4 [Coffea eugenioides]